MKRLSDIGFEKVGKWTLVGDQLELELAGLAKAKRVLYAFLSQDEIKYIGKTSGALRRRLYGYKSPGPTQSTNIKNNVNIRKVLADGGSVDIWALADHGHLHYGEFQVSLAAGLEDDLIVKIQPQWNGTGNSLRKASPRQSGGSDLQGNDGQFDFVLRKTYHDQGFFNVGVDFESLFANDGTPIEIRLGTNQFLVDGYINRTANSNGTPRIMGGVHLRNWFQRTFAINETVSVKVLSLTSIWIH